ncbi:MAG: hypothetical protein Roseis2KO_12270 [Roseivirga sp.]
MEYNKESNTANMIGPSIRKDFLPSSFIALLFRSLNVITANVMQSVAVSSIIIDSVELIVNGRTVTPTANGKKLKSMKAIFVTM